MKYSKLVELPDVDDVSLTSIFDIKTYVVGEYT